MNRNSVRGDILLDISSCTQEFEMISILSKYRDEDFQSILDYYLSLYKRLLNESYFPYNILYSDVLAVYRVCNNSFQERSFIDIDSEKYNLFFSKLSDYDALIKDGYSGNMNMPDELIDFLSHYNKSINEFKELGFVVKGLFIDTLA